MSSDDACDENWYDSGSGRAPPLRGVLGLLPAPLGGPGVFTPMSPSKV